LENDIVIKKARTNFIHVERCASTGPAGPARHAAKSRRKLSRAGHFLSRVVVVDAAKRAALDFLTLHTRVLVVMGVRSFVKVKNTIQKRERDKKKKKKTKKKEDLSLLCSALLFFFEIFFTHSTRQIIKWQKRDGRLLLDHDEYEGSILWSTTLCECFWRVLRYIYVWYDGKTRDIQ
jgi:hypothetical protein